MSKKTLALIGLAVVLGGLYLFYFTDLFQKPALEIAPRIRTSTPRGGKPEIQVSFTFSSKCRLTEVKVVSVAGLATNKYAHAVWHLIADTNSVPVKGIVYGETIRGMKPNIPKVRAEPLEPRTRYRLLVATAENLRGEVDFEVPARR